MFNFEISHRQCLYDTVSDVVEKKVQWRYDFIHRNCGYILGCSQRLASLLRAQLEGVPIDTLWSKKCDATHRGPQLTSFDPKKRQMTQTDVLDV